MPLSRPGMPAATPMLTVRATVWPPIVSRSYTVFRIRSAKSSACLRRHRLVWNDDELVATQPGDHALASGAVAQAIGESADEPVAGGVPEANR